MCFSLGMDHKPSLIANCKTLEHNANSTNRNPQNTELAQNMAKKIVGPNNLQVV